MARARNIKPGFCTNEDLAECSMTARLCFALLPMIADREGRLEDRPKRIKGELFRFDSIEIEPLLDELESRGFIARYTVSGLALIQILGFRKHQNPHHREPESVLPPHPSLRLDGDGKYAKPEALGTLEDGEAQGQAEALVPTSDMASGSSLPVQRGVSRVDSGFRIPDSGNLIPDAVPPGGEPPMAPAPLPEGPSTKAGEIGKAFKRAGVDPTQLRLTDPVLVALIDQGAQPEEFEEAAKDAIDRGIERVWPYVLKAVQGRRRDAAKVALAPKPADPMAWRSTTEGVFAMGEKLRVKLLPTEEFNAYERRVLTAFQRHQPQESAA